MPFASAWIAEINAAIDAATHEPAVGQLRPIAGAHDARIPRAHVKHAVGIAAERELLFEPIHRDSGLFLLSIAVKNSGDLRLYIDTVLLMPKDFKVYCTPEMGLLNHIRYSSRVAYTCSRCVASDFSETQQI